jgi:hypothetical protein
VESLLEVKPNDLRDKKLAQFDNDTVDRITVERSGKPNLSLARDGAKGWVTKGDKDTEANASMVTKMLDDLSATAVSNFVADVATELPKYGLDQPSLKITLSSYASENTAETKAGEKPIATLLFGKEENTDVYVKLEDEPFVLSVPKTLLDSIVSDPLQLQSLDVYKNKPDDITSFEVVREGQPALAFERDKDKNWKLAKGDDKVNTINVQSLVNTLSSLRAVRWTGATTPEHGFEKAAATVSFKTSGNINGTLTIGSALPDEMRHAKADGLTGTFIIAKPDFDAFTSSLLEKPAAAVPVPEGAAPENKPKVEVVTPPISVPATPADGAPAPPSEAAKPPQ